MKAILRILLFSTVPIFFADASAQNMAPAKGGELSKETGESIKPAAPGTYIILFRESHQEVIELNDQLLRRVAAIRRSSATAYLKVNDNILVKVLPQGILAPAYGEDDFIYVTSAEFDELLQEAVL